MKEELMNFLEAHSLFKYELDSGSEQQLRNALDQFFEQYQPERSKREDCEKGMNERRSHLLDSYEEWKCDHCNSIIRRCGALNTMET